MRWNRRGAVAAEYALITGLIALGMVLGLLAVGQAIEGPLSQAQVAVSSGEAPGNSSGHSQGSNGSAGHW